MKCGAECDRDAVARVVNEAGEVAMCKRCFIQTVLAIGVELGVRATGVAVAAPLPSLIMPVAASALAELVPETAENFAATVEVL